VAEHRRATLGSGGHRCLATEASLGSGAGVRCWATEPPFKMAVREYFVRENGKLVKISYIPDK